MATYRAEAFHLTRSAKAKQGYTVPAKGDIAISFTFYPPDNRSDRTNFAGRMKAQIDGIAEALGVNDKRFLPSYHFADPCKPGRVEVQLSPCGYAPSTYADSPDSAKENADRESALTLNPGPAKLAKAERT